MFILLCVSQFIESRNRGSQGKGGSGASGKKSGGAGKDSGGIEIVDGYVKDSNGKFRRGRLHYSSSFTRDMKRGRGAS